MPDMRISVAVCTYNGADLLPAQLQSIAEQSRPPDEIIVCDDASTDETRAVLESFARTSPIPISLHFADQNVGSVKNFERAIGLCNGDVIALSDQDDVWRADKLQLIDDAFRRNPNAGLIFSDAEIVDHDLKPSGQRMWHAVGFDAHKQKLLRTGRALEVLITGWTVTGATMAFRSGYKKLALPIPTNIAMIHDGWIGLSIAAVADVVSLEEPLIKYRQHQRQQIGARSRAKRSAEQLGRIKTFETAFRRRSSNADMLKILTTLEERILAHGDAYDTRKAVSFIADYSFHLNVRDNLPSNRLNRLPRILRELLTRRYHDYANGFKSAAKDLVS